jgi:hypothetical protein
MPALVQALASLDTDPVGILQVEEAEPARLTNEVSAP